MPSRRTMARMPAEETLTGLIEHAGDGDAAALRRLFERAYIELRALARLRLARGGRGAILDTTALVHESFLRFANAGQLRLADRQHFLRYAAAVMRSVIVDIVRQGAADRRGGQAPHVTLDTAIGDQVRDGETEILRVHDALEELGRRDPRLVQVVEMRYFAGMTERQIGAALGIGERTVRRDWEKARLLLAEALASA